MVCSLGNCSRSRVASERVILAFVYSERVASPNLGVSDSAHRSAVCLSVTYGWPKSPTYFGSHRAISLCTLVLLALYPSSGSTATNWVAPIGTYLVRPARASPRDRVLYIVRSDHPLCAIPLAFSRLEPTSGRSVSRCEGD